MTPEDVRAAQADGAVVLDMRPPKPFAKEHVPGAVNIQFNRADLADRAEMSLPPEASYVVHAEPEPIAEIAVSILSQAGFTLLGYLQGGLEAWLSAGYPTVELPVIDVDALHANLGSYTVVDTREGFEFRYGHIAGSKLFEWTEPWTEFEKLDDAKPIALVCGDQVRSSFVASVITRAGKNAVLVFGGLVDWIERGYPVEKTTQEAKTPAG